MQIKVGFLPLTDTSATVALLSLGVDLAKLTDPDTRKAVCPISTEKNAAHPHGISTYALALHAASGIKAGDLLQAWHERRADVELDELLDRLVASLQNTPHAALAAEIRTILPYALMAYYRGFSENRSRLLDLRSRGYQFERFQRTDTGFVLISANASEQTRAELGLPPKTR